MIYVTSDIHGYPLPEFQKLLAKAGFGRTDELYVIGDVIDRNGDGGVAMLRWMMTQENVHFLRGNHEQFLLSCDFLFEEITEDGIRLLNPYRMELYRNWVRNGARPTIHNLRQLIRENREEFDDLMDYIREAPLYDILKVNGKVYLLVHAGLGNYSSDREIDEYTDDELVWTRPELIDTYYPGVTVILGHTPTVYYDTKYSGRMLRTASWIDIDTGAGRGGAPMLFRLEDEKPFYADR